MVTSSYLREAIKEDDHGLLEASVADIIHNAKRKRQLEKKQGARLGMMRHLYVILDASESMSNQDLKPTRFLCSLKVNSAQKRRLLRKCMYSLLIICFVLSF